MRRDRVGEEETVAYRSPERPKGARLMTGGAGLRTWGHPCPAALVPDHRAATAPTRTRFRLGGL